jgi:hypothetical protein
MGIVVMCDLCGTAIPKAGCPPLDRSATIHPSTVSVDDARPDQPTGGRDSRE